MDEAVVTWQDLTAIEPRLVRIESELRSGGVSRDFCAMETWLTVSAEFRYLVGVGRVRDGNEFLSDEQESLLRAPESRKLAEAHLKDMLPACRHEPNEICPPPPYPSY